ncbi:MAG: dTDP-4-dehydrorhamnose reductase [Fimbriimonadaceae bacterium]
MRLFVTGGSGLLGQDLVPTAVARGHEVVALSSADFDVTDPLAVARFGTGEFGAFDWCINLAAYTNVDGAESHHREAVELNEFAPAYLGAACLANGARLWHVSTDYVFGGGESSAYSEDDPLSPVQKYGESKAIGEFEATYTNPDSIVARVSWLYGPAKRCFPLALIESFKVGKPLRIVNDQFGVPSYTSEVARMTLDLIEADADPGIYHVAGSDAVSRFQYAEAVARAYERAAGVPASELTPVASVEFPTPAKRPMNSVIRTDKVRKYTKPHSPIDAAMDSMVRRVLEDVG